MLTCCLCWGVGRVFETRRKEHERKVILTDGDITKGMITSAATTAGKGDVGLARHSITCKVDVDWEESKVIAFEHGLRQRKVREGIESLKEKYNGNSVLDAK